MVENAYLWAVVLSGSAALLSLMLGLGMYGKHNATNAEAAHISSIWRDARNRNWERYEQRLARFLIRRAAPRCAIACGCLIVLFLLVALLAAIVSAL